MTIQEKLEKMLFERGLFENQATEVLERVKTSEGGVPMQGRWGEDITAYPQQMLNVLWMIVRAETVKWIDDNFPQAWFRPVFADDK